MTLDEQIDVIMNGTADLSSNGGEGGFSDEARDNNMEWFSDPELRQSTMGQRPNTHAPVLTDMGDGPQVMAKAEKEDDDPCWEGYERVPGTKQGAKGSCRPVKKADGPDDDGDGVPDWEDEDQDDPTKKALEKSMDPLSIYKNFLSEVDLEKAKYIKRESKMGKSLGDLGDLSTTAEGGPLEGVGTTSGSSDSSPGPGQDSKGQVTGTSTKSDKLSEDDETDEKQMREHNKPIARGGEKVMMKGDVPAAQRDLVAYENAREARRLQSVEDISLSKGLAERAAPVELEKAVTTALSEHVVHSNASDLAAERLLKSDSMYEYNQPPTLYGPPNQLRQHTQCGTCETIFMKSLTACPNCGEGGTGADITKSVVHKHGVSDGPRPAFGFGFFHPSANPDVDLPR